MKTLSKDLRENMIDFLAQREMDSLRDYSSRDLYELARSGLPGFEESTDLELLDEYIRFKDGGCYCTEDCSDPALKALKSLLFVKEDPTHRAEIQHFIDLREKELIGIPVEKREVCNDCKEVNTTIEQAKRELGL